MVRGGEGDEQLRCLLLQCREAGVHAEHDGAAQRVRHVSRLHLELALVVLVGHAQVPALQAQRLLAARMHA